MGKTLDLVGGPIDSTLRRFAIPLAFSFLVNMVYIWIDTFYVSRLGASAIAALGVSEQLVFLLFTLASGFPIGTSIIVARRIGEGNWDDANRIAAMSTVFMFFLSVVLAAILYYFINDILQILQFKGKEGRLAAIYLSGILIGMPANLLVFQINALVRSLGNSVFPMTILILSTILNAIIAPFLIFGLGPFPEMGIYGAGIATATAQIIGCLISVFSLIYNYTPLRIRNVSIKLDWKIIWKITFIGIPATLMLLTVSLNRLFLIALAKSFGTNVAVAYTLGLKVDLFVFMPVFAVGIALETITGQNIGANQIPRVFEYYKSGVKQLSVLMIILGIAAFFGGGYFAQLYRGEPDIIHKTSEYLRITAFSYIPFSIGILSARVISGAGDTIRSLLIVSAIFILIQFPATWSLSKISFLHQNGIWLGILLSQILFACLGYYNISKGKWLGKRV